MKCPQMSNYQLAYLGVWGCILIQVGCHDAFHFCIAVLFFTEFLPYVFQVLSLLLEIRHEIPEPYMELFPLLLSTVLWERNGTRLKYIF